MWRPRTESEIETGIANGLARESSSFDAKMSLPQPGRNKDLAKDICAMTVDGGSLLYGLGGDDPTRPDRVAPFLLAGAAERVDQIAQTGIAEAPVIEIHDILSERQPGLGYLCVVVPASPRAPHMLTIDNDNRYWGRGATGNRILTEGEIARLYERRARWEVDRNQLLADAVDNMPFEFEASLYGPMVTIVHPVLPGRDLLRLAASGHQMDDFLRNQLVQVANRTDPYPDQGTLGLGEAFEIARSGADVWVLSSPRTSGPDFPYQARAHLTAGGALTYWHSPILFAEPSGRSRVMERSVTRAVCQALATSGWLFTQAGFHGSVDLGVAVLGIESSSGSSLVHGISPRAYGARDYRRHERVTTAELVSVRDEIVRRLLGPLFDVISVRGYDPFGDRG